MSQKVGIMLTIKSCGNTRSGMLLVFLVDNQPEPCTVRGPQNTVVGLPDSEHLKTVLAYTDIFLSNWLLFQLISVSEPYMLCRSTQQASGSNLKSKELNMQECGITENQPRNALF
jgi:hypothetical protein